jgi:hypothetical protein
MVALPEAISAKQYRVIALARLDKKQDALTELAKFQKEDAPEHSKRYLAAVVAAKWMKEQPRHLRHWKQRSRNSQRMRNCAMTQPVPVRYRQKPFPARTRRRVINSQSDPCNDSGRPSRTSMPILARWMRTATSTRSGTTQPLPKS